MTDLLDLPALAIDVLRRYMLQRAQNGLPVAWYSGGHRHTAEPRPDKAEGSWLLSGNRWTTYCDKARVLSEIGAADTFDLSWP